MLALLVSFVVGSGAVLGAYAAYVYLPGIVARRRLERRLVDVSATPDAAQIGGSVVMRPIDGPLPVVDRLASRIGGGRKLARLIDQSGAHTTPSAVMLVSAACAAIAAIVAAILVRSPFAPLLAIAIGAATPTLILIRRRSRRLHRIEEQFPDALDLLSRALRAGHAFQTALGMVADEVPPPVGPEFKKTFDQQNFGLPLREALGQMAERVPLLDIRFFVTAVLIQRETGGNLAEILDNLAHVVRERFKIIRQVRVHTAHGRFTAWVLLSLPAVLAVVLSFINPGHMQLLFREHMGRMMLAAAIVMQAVGYLWIRKVIRIEV
jgi:tight adherence protein B